MRFDGKLKSWNDERGFGFIESTQGGQEIFVHIKAFPDGTGRPSVGLPLTFEVELGPQGKKRAKSVQFAAQGRRLARQRVEHPARWSLPRVLAIPLFVGVAAYVGLHWSIKPVVVLVYFVVSLVAFLAYALDKSAAVQGRWRISEATLHLFSLAGGWPGALIAQQLLRHKSAKPSFVASFWATVVLNVAGFVAIHSPFLARLRT